MLTFFCNFRFLPRPRTWSQLLSATRCHGYIHVKVDQLHMIIFKSRDSPFDGEAESV